MNYDKYPEIKINGFDDQVFADVQGIKNELEKYSQESQFCMTVECYPGVEMCIRDSCE